MIVQRRLFLALSSAGVLGMTSPRSLRSEVEAGSYHSFHGVLTAGSPKPLTSITLAVDAVLPKDPLVSGDFAASDYGADAVVAAKLGVLGQGLLAWCLNYYALRSAKKLFVHCREDERCDAIRSWIRNRDNASRISRELLSGLLTLSVVGTFEGKPKEIRDDLYEKMGWYDPDRPGETYNIPCHGYANLAP